ncbi:hypothetical protein [Amycolatopsis sp. NPDC051061]|uniref:hypothetical protein n=1 Tax=Amycolatopsis sp. NPDC051061 TaxID=3155042 RepID=UPI00342DE49E
MQLQLPVDLRFAVGFRGSQHLPDVTEPLGQVVDLLFAQPLLRGAGDDACLGFGSAGLGFGDPSGDQGGVGAGFEGCAMASECPVAFLDGLGGGCCARVDVEVGLGFVKGVDGVVDPVGCEAGAEPAVEWADEVAFGEVDVAGARSSSPGRTRRGSGSGRTADRGCAGLASAGCRPRNAAGR